MSSFAHPDDDQWAHFLRFGMPKGYVVVDRSELMAFANQVDPVGTGHVLDMALSDPPVTHHEVRTHFEVGGTDGNSFIQGSGASHGVWFERDIGNGAEPFVAIACGRVLEGSNNPVWSSLAGRALAMVYSLDPNPLISDEAPELRMILVGTKVINTDMWTKMATEGNAWMLEVTQRPSGAWALVADVGGRVLAYRLDDAELENAIDESTALTPAMSNITLRDAYLPLPNSPFDGLHENVIDLEVDGDLLYVMSVRRGITVIDLTYLDQSPPALDEHPSSPIDTPGLAEGVMLLRSGPDEPATGMVVGDGRGGLRLYR